MLQEGTLVEVIGAFTSGVETVEYTMLDPFEKGAVDLTEEYITNGTTEITCDCHKDKLDESTFVKLSGQFEVVRSNDIFTKIKVGDHLVSVPNNKLLEVEK